MDTLSSKNKMRKLREVDLRVVARYITGTSGKLVKESMTKASKIERLSEVFGFEKPTFEVRIYRRKATPRRLGELAASVLPKNYIKNLLKSLCQVSMARTLRKIVL